MTCIARKKIVFVGAGGHALSCHDVLMEDDSCVLVGYIDPKISEALSDFDLKYFGDDDVLEKLLSKDFFFHVALGQITSALPRSYLYDKLVSLGHKLHSIVSPRATVSRLSTFGSGVFIGRNATVNSNAVIGDNCIINTGAIVEHGAQIGDHCHIAPGAIILGDTVIGNESFIGAGSIIREGISVLAGSVIPAGSRVMSNANEF